MAVGLAGIRAPRLGFQRRPRFSASTFRALESAAAPQQFSATGAAPAPASAQPAPAPAGGFPAGGSPSNPFGSGDLMGFVRDFRSGKTPLNRSVLGFVNEGLRAGALGPGYRSQQLEAGALCRGDSLRRRNSILTQLLGLDPGQARVAAVNQENQISQQIADLLGGAEAGGIEDYQQRLLQLLMGQLDSETRRYEAKQARKAQSGASLGGALGSLGSAFLRLL